MYRFVKIKYHDIDYGQWYLYCDSLTIMEEHMRKYVKLDMITGIKDKIKYPYRHASSEWRSCVEMLQEIHEKSFIEASLQLENTMWQNKINSLLKDNILLLTSGCAYMELIDDFDIVESVWLNEMKFPQYNKSDIRVLQWPGGNHYYAKIGNVDVVYNGKQKWNTYDDAKHHAELYYESLLRNNSLN